MQNPPCGVTLTPAQSDNAGEVERLLLDQCKCVWAGLVMPVWLKDGTCITVSIGKKWLGARLTVARASVAFPACHLVGS